MFDGHFCRLNRVLSASINNRERDSDNVWTGRKSPPILLRKLHKDIQMCR